MVRGFSNSNDDDDDDDNNNDHIEGSGPEWCISSILYRGKYRGADSHTPCVIMSLYSAAA